MVDLTNYNLEELNVLRVEVLTRIEQLQIIESAPAQADAISRRYLQAVGRIPDNASDAARPWVKPQEAYEAYPQDTTVSHGGKEWVSDQRTNMDEPGTTPDWVERKSSQTDAGDA